MVLNAIDLFSGGGGLSEGLKQAGFKILSAVENHSIAADTYRLNHKDTFVFERDIQFVSIQDILEKSNIKKGELDLLAGCPPCQGFSKLTAKYKREDARNALISEVTRLVKGLMPKVIMIENVPGIITKGHDYFNKFIRTIKKLGYKVNYDVLQVADYGVPQNRKRFVLLAGLDFEIKIPTPTHSQKGENNLLPWMTVKDALVGLEQPISLEDSFEYGGPQFFNWNITRHIADINIERLKYLKPGGQRFDIPDHLRPPCHKGNNSGFSNVYTRMSWNDVSPTITGGCTVLSKGRFGHPSELRTISVREAARLQTFPDTYKFATDLIDHACQIIGNALPCTFAQVMGEACYNSLMERKSSLSTNVE